MIPRYQKILSCAPPHRVPRMGFLLWQLRHRAHGAYSPGRPSAHSSPRSCARRTSHADSCQRCSKTPYSPQIRSLPLPADPGARARAVLGKLLDLYAAPDAVHPVGGGATSVAQVFLLPCGQKLPGSKAQVAVVNLTGTFAASHPSGIETETLDRPLHLRNAPRQPAQCHASSLPGRRSNAPHPRRSCRPDPNLPDRRGRAHRGK